MDTDQILTLLKNVADEVINPRFRALSEGDIQEKAPGDLVTIADHESERLISAALQAAYPQALILGEEASAQDDSLLGRFARADHVFTVDPVDGTKNFVNGSPDHAVMVSEMQGGEVTRAWIWQPQHQQAYVAESGGGAWRNGERLRRDAPAADPASWRGCTSRRAWRGRELPGLRPLQLTWICCGVDYPHLVEGDVDLLLYSGSMPWDHAPGSLLLREAGGWHGWLDGSPYLPQQPAPAGRAGVLIGAASSSILTTLEGAWPD